MKMAGCNWKQQFCLLFVQSLIVVVISSFLVIWGIELIGNRMDFFSLQAITMTFPPEILFDTRYAIYHSSYIALCCNLSVCICPYSQNFDTNRHSWRSK